jgi:dsDNA-specific endonuclease/ATPase MutS2
MSLYSERILITRLKENKNLQVIQVKTTNENFEKRFEGSISMFFRSLKNGLYSFQGITNREYFKGLSGVYFSLEHKDVFEIIIVYDTKVKDLNKIQIMTRLKKLLGIEVEISIGEFMEFENRIHEMIGIRQKTQSFGDYYLRKNIV